MQETITLTLTMCDTPPHFYLFQKVTVAVDRLWIAKNVILQLYMYQSSTADLPALVDIWIEATRGGALLESLKIEACESHTTQEAYNSLVLKLQDGLRKSSAKGKMVGHAFTQNRCSIDSEPFLSMIKKLNEQPAE